MHRVKPNSFALHVTYTCPLSCKHCCFNSSPKNKDRLAYDLMEKSIKELDKDKYKLVAFTGGEPMLLGRQLEKLVSLASSRGFSTRIVSSVHFASSEEVAFKRLSDLKDAGLKELSISWDDFHEEFVAFENIKRAVRACIELGISVAISITEDQDSSWNSARVRKELGTDADKLSTICDSPLNKTGRAAVELAEKPKLSTSHLGPCPYILTGPTLSAKGKLLACCGVIPETSALVIEKEFVPENMENSLAKAQNSVLYNWLYALGPYDLMTSICKENNLPLPDPANVHGNCEACQMVLNDEKYTKRINLTLQKNSQRIGDLIHVLGELGTLQDGLPVRFLPA